MIVGLLTLVIAMPFVMACFLVLGSALLFQDTWIKCSEQNSVTYRFLRRVNGVRERIGRPPLWLVPDSEPELLMAQHADEMFEEVQQALNSSPVSADRKSALRQQTRQVQRNIVESLWKWHRLRRYRSRLQTSPLPASRNVAEEAQAMEEKLLQATQESLKVLQSLPVSLAILDLARGNRHADQMLADLREANQRIRDLADSYEAVHLGSADLHEWSGNNRERAHERVHAGRL